MGFLGGTLGYHLLRSLAPPKLMTARENALTSAEPEFEMFFGSEFLTSIKGKTVVDYGCGWGHDAVEMAKLGANVIGIDVQERFLKSGQTLASEQNLSDRCRFASSTDEKVDIVVSKAAFEHFADPASVLADIARILKPDGCVYASFGNTWFHPYGGHTFSIFPWSHLIFTEAALIRWRSDFKTDGANTFSGVEGGLNKITIRQFEQYVNSSPLRFETFETLPIRGKAFLKHPLLREIGTWLIRSTLRHR